MWGLTVSWLKSIITLLHKYTENDFIEINAISEIKQEIPETLSSRGG